MSFLGIVGSRYIHDASSSFRQDVSFSLFITIGLATFCGIPPRYWNGNDNIADRAVILSLIPSGD